MTFADVVLEQLFQLHIGKPLPRGVSVLNPYEDAVVQEVCRIFYRRFYGDSDSRRLIVGINPGRFGGGITGIPFTDPVKLAEQCDIPNNLGHRTELSADFIYRVIEAYGGTQSFYRNVYVTAVSPLGFTFNGKNLNYYDIPALQKAVTPFAIRCIEHLLKANVDRSVCYCVGEGQNFRFFSGLNEQFHWFKTIVPLAHPRFVMQYKRKMLKEYVNNYVSALKRQ